MSRWMGFGVVLAALMLGGSTYGQAIPALEGKWKVISGQMHGQVVPASATNSMNLTITAGSFRGESSGLVSSGNLAPDAATPSKIKFSITSGNDLGRTLNAMYRVEGTSLTIVFSETEEFPTSFESTTANRYLVLTYQQVGVAGVDAASGGDGRAGLGNEISD